MYSCLVIKRGAADLKQVRSLAPPAHFNARKWFQHIYRLATDAATFAMLVEFDVITEIGGAHALDKRAKATATETTELATDTLLAIASRDRTPYKCIVKCTLLIPNKKNISSSSAKKCSHQQKNAISTTQALKMTFYLKLYPKITLHIRTYTLDGRLR